MNEKQGEVKNVIVCRERLSPYWIGQWTDGRGRRVRRSTKVPVGGGVYKGERLGAGAAQRRALIVAYEMARAREEEWVGVDNTTVREVFAAMLAGKLGRVSVATYNNARTAYKFFAEYVGEGVMGGPVRLVTKAMVRGFVDARRRVVRHQTVHKDLSLISSAFRWAVECEIIGRNPCEGVRVAADARDERVVHEAFTAEEVRVLLEKLPEEWAGAVRVCIGTYGQRLGDCLQLRWDAVDWEGSVVGWGR